MELKNLTNFASQKNLKNYIMKNYISKVSGRAVLTLNISFYLWVMYLIITSIV